MSADILNIGLLNLAYGRDPKVVRGEVSRAFAQYGLDGLCVQEAAGYFKVLSNLGFAEYFCDVKGDRGNRQNGILVSGDRKARFPRYATVGNGWIVGGGVQHAPSPIPKVSIDWLRVASVHWPSDSEWTSGRLTAPEPRLDDIKAQARYAVRFLKFPGPRAYLGDLNEPPGSEGLWSPRWVANQAKADIAHPDTKWNIDYGIYKGCRAISCRKYSGFQEGSDHDLVVIKFARS